MKLELCNKCASRYVMCFSCERNEYYREGRDSHDEFVAKKAVEEFTRNIIKQLEELKIFRLSSLHLQKQRKEIGLKVLLYGRLYTSTTLRV